MLDKTIQDWNSDAAVLEIEGRAFINGRFFRCQRVNNSYARGEDATQARSEYPCGRRCTGISPRLP